MSLADTPYDWQQARSVGAAMQLVITAYINQKAVRSIASLARASGVPYTTVRRIRYGLGQADLATINPILRVVMSSDEYLAFMHRYYSQAYQVLAAIYAPPPPAGGNGGRKPAYDAAANAIVQLCAARDGIEEAELKAFIKEHYGAQGTAHYAMVLKGGYLEIKGTRVYLQWSRFRERTLAILLKEIEILTHLFSRKNLGTDAALLGLISENVSHQGLGLLKAAGQTYLHQVREAQEKYQGRDMVYCLGMMQNIFGAADRLGIARQ